MVLWSAGPSGSEHPLQLARLLFREPLGRTPNARLNEHAALHTIKTPAHVASHPTAIPRAVILSPLFGSCSTSTGRRRLGPNQKVLADSQLPLCDPSIRSHHHYHLNHGHLVCLLLEMWGHSPQARHVMAELTQSCSAGKAPSLFPLLRSLWYCANIDIHTLTRIHRHT